MTLKDIKEKVLPRARRRARARGERVRHARGAARRHREPAARAARRRARGAFRAAAVDALVDASNVESRPSSLVERATASCCAGCCSSLERRGINLETYFALTGQTAEQLEERLVAEAPQAIARELVLEAVAEELDLEITDEEIERSSASRRRGDETIGRSSRSRFGRDAAPGSAAAEGPRPHRGRGQADPGRAGGSARQAVDARSRRKPQAIRSCGPPAARSLHEPSDSDGDRADVARRAFVRHLLPAAERADHLPRDARSTTRSPT